MAGLITTQPRGRVRKFFSNGWKFHMLMFVVTLLVFGALLANVFHLFIVQPDFPLYQPLRVEGPVLVRSRVDGFDLPAVVAGESIVWTRNLCNDSDEPVTGTGQGTFVFLDSPGGQVPATDPPIANVTIPSGCTPAEFQTLTTRLSDNVGEGRWLLRATATVHDSAGRTQTYSYDTEPFFVLEGE